LRYWRKRGEHVQRIALYNINICQSIADIQFEYRLFYTFVPPKTTPTRLLAHTHTHTRTIADEKKIILRRLSSVLICGRGLPSLSNSRRGVSRTPLCKRKRRLVNARSYYNIILYGWVCSLIRLVRNNIIVCYYYYNTVVVTDFATYCCCRVGLCCVVLLLLLYYRRVYVLIWSGYELGAISIIIILCVSSRLWNTTQ